MKKRADDEKVYVCRITALDDIEALHARFRRQTFTRHSHTGYAFGTIEDGALGFHYLGNDYVAPRGSINLAVPGEVHDGHAAAREGWQYRMLYVPCATLQGVAGELGGSDLRLPSFSGGVLYDRALAQELSRTHACLLQAGESLLEQQCRLHHFLTGLLLRHAGYTPERSIFRPLPREVEHIRQYLQDNHVRNVSIDELSRLSGLSRFHLVRVFKEKCGVPPHAYLRQVRLEHARRLLAGGSSIADAALASGFADQSHMTRWFKHIWGYTPGQYRNSVQYR